MPSSANGRPDPTPTRGKMVNAFDPATATGLDASAKALITRRQSRLGPAYRLFYRTPVTIVRGCGVHLYDPDGNEYLDAYNNVVPAGHCHPRIVQAISEQMRTLCTHTRYLQPGILEYADALLSTFGSGDLAHVMFTCTGSEANDLALRIAKRFTGHAGLIVTSEAYHGNSEQTAGISPSLGIYSALGTWVRRVPAPDSYRRPPAELGQWFADRVREQIADLQRHGQGLAAFIADSLFSSDGIYSDPNDLLAPVARVVKEAGGLFIADEVQAGFARSGDRFWGYQRHGIAPDIVTLGKPMGNGYPVAAVVLREEVIREFGRDTRYFNTFGGNSVAIAAAQATLDVIQDEALCEQSREVGERLRVGLRQLASNHACIGDVRGAGLYIGCEIVSNRSARTPDAALTADIVNGLRERRVLISATGPEANVLKIRPPLVFSQADADRLLTELEQVLRTVDHAS